MKKIFALLVILAFVLASCAKETKVTVTEGAPSTQTTTASGSASSPAASSAASSGAMPNIQSLEADGLACLKDTIRVCRPVNFQIGKVGDTVGFAFGIQNLFNDPKRFAIKLKYIRTQQTMGQSGINADKDTLTQWLAVNDLESFYEIQPGEKLSKPILVKIGNEVAGGSPTVPGTYVFEVQAQTFENGFYEDYEGAQEISVKVK